MKHIDIYEIFKELFPVYSQETVEWFQNGKDTIRVRLNGGSDFVFIYHNKDDWSFETLESYIRKMRGGVIMKC